MCRPKDGMVCAPIWSEKRYIFCPFWSGNGYSFRGNHSSVWMYSSFQSKWIRKKGQYANSMSSCWRSNLSDDDIMYRSNRSFNMPPPGHTPGIWHLFHPGEEGIWLSESSRGWGIWTAPSISCKIFGVTSYHGGRGVRGFSRKRLCLCGQLVTRKGLKQALCRFWSI